MSLNIHYEPFNKFTIEPGVTINLSETMTSAIVNFSSSYQLGKYISLWGKARGNLVNAEVDYLEDFDEWTAEVGIGCKF